MDGVRGAAPRNRVRSPLKDRKASGARSRRARGKKKLRTARCGRSDGSSGVVSARGNPDDRTPKLLEDSRHRALLANRPDRWIRSLRAVSPAGGRRALTTTSSRSERSVPLSLVARGFGRKRNLTRETRSLHACPREESAVHRRRTAFAQAIHRAVHRDPFQSVVDVGRRNARGSSDRNKCQSNRGPGSVLRPGAISLWPAAASIG